MKTNSLFFILLSILAFPLFGQDCNQLATITEGFATNSGGLGVTFIGEVGNDGLLYFKGSDNGVRLSIWKTDGTAAGTSKIIEETSTFSSNWDAYHFTRDGVFIWEDGVWYLLENGANSLTELPQMGDIPYEKMVEDPDGSYWFIGDENGQTPVLNYNPADGSTIIIDSVHPRSSFGEVYAGTHAALFFPKSNSIDGETTFYDKEQGELISVVSYLGSLGYVVDDYNGGSVVDKYLYSTFKNDANQFVQVLINLDTDEITEFDHVTGEILHVEHDDDIFFIGNNTVMRYNKADGQASEAFDQVALFTTYLIFQDKLILQGENPDNDDNVQLVAIDLNSYEVSYLPDTPIGNFYQNCKMLEFGGKLYYTSEDTDFIYLNEFDFGDMSSSVVDELSEVTGATVVHGLESVRGNLVASKRFDFLQHELFVCDPEGSSIFEVDLPSQLKVYPTVVEEILTLVQNDVELRSKVVHIHNASGQLVDKLTVSDYGQLDVAALKSGLYYGSLSGEGEVYTIRFIKM